jgi:hypothetical protein
MANPWKRVFTALSFIRGPNVDDWVEDQVKEIRLKNTGTRQIAKTDDVLWQEFKNAFTTAYTDSTIQQTAYRKLQELRMKGQDLDSFIATFKHLATKAGFGLADAATKDLFAKALTHQLLSAILNRDTFDPRTATLAEWETAARREIQRYETRNSMLSKWPKAWHSPQTQGKRGGFQRSSNQRSYVHPNDRSVPMDVDAARKATTEEAKKKHRKEGRCFECDKQGHMASQCPHKQRQQQGQQKNKQRQSFRPKQRSNTKPNFRTSFARVAEMLDTSDEEDLDLLAEDSDSGSDELNISDLAARTARFSDEQRDTWVTEMKKLGVDF